MASYQPIVNPFTGKLQLIRSDSAFHLKDNVPTYNDLPITGNAENDVRITADDDTMYTWGIASSSGLITDWKPIGSSTAVDWSAITGKPSSSPANIDDAVAKKHTQGSDSVLGAMASDINMNTHKLTGLSVPSSDGDSIRATTKITEALLESATDLKHTQGTDQKLDEGGANEVVVADVKDAVTKKHTQDTDIGTDNASFNINNAGLDDGILLSHYETIEYTTDVCEGGTATALASGYGSNPGQAFDNNEGTAWYQYSAPPSFPTWLKYDLGADNEKIVAKLRVKFVNPSIYNGIFQGSNNDSDWDNLYTFSVEPSGTEWKEKTFANTTLYRYYRLYIQSSWNAGQVLGVAEMEMMEVKQISNSLKVQKGDGSGDYSNTAVKGLLTEAIYDENGENRTAPADIKDAVAKRHTQDTDTGTDSDEFVIDTEESVHGGISLKTISALVYGSDICTGGTASAQDFHGAHPPAHAFDDNTGTFWLAQLSPPIFPNWIKYDLGSGNEKTVAKLRLRAYGNTVKSALFQGSNNDSTWDTLYSIVNGAEDNAFHDYTFSNGTAYRYYRLYITYAVGGGSQPTGVWEMEMMEIVSGLDGLEFKDGDGSGIFRDIKANSLLTSAIKDNDGVNASTPAEIKTALDVTIPNKIDKIVDEYQKLLLHCDGTDTSTSFPDASLSNHTVTANGNAQVDTAIKEFGTGDFTIDFWMRENTRKADAGIFTTASSSIAGYKVSQNSNKLTFGNISTVNYVASGILPAVGTLNHYAFIKHSGILKCYINGVESISASNDGGTFDSAGTGFQIGRLYTGTNNYYHDGSIDEFRVSKGIARWTSNFIPPTSAYSGILNQIPIISTDGVLIPSSAHIDDVSDAIYKKHTQNTDEDIIIDSTPATDVTASGIKSTFTAGENVAFGDVCYVKSDGKLWKGDANAVATASVVAMSLGTILADASGSFLLMGIARNDAWAWTVGALLYLSGTAGELTETAPSASGDQVQIVGVATHADRIYFKPELVQVEVA